MAGRGEVDSAILIRFAQKLAGNEKKWRDIALKKLRKWLERRATISKGGMSKDEMLKIWKGLHYCMWMSDKPLVQEELADSLSKLIHCFKKPQTSLLFLEVFIITEAREWFGIDRLRLDKFMMLIRRCVNQSFVVIKNNGWSPKTAKSFNDLYSKNLISGDNTDIPDGLRYHMADIFLDELEKVALNEVNSDTVLLLLDPYCNMLAEMKNQTLFKYVVKNVFDVILTWGTETQADDADSEEESEDEDKEEIQKLPVDYAAVADRLFALASGKTCLGRNRKPIYDLVTRFRNMAEGILPEEEDFSSDAGDVEEEILKAARSLIKFENKIAKSKGKKRVNKETSAESPKKKKKIDKPEASPKASTTSTSQKVSKKKKIIEKTETVTPATPADGGEKKKKKIAQKPDAQSEDLFAAASWDEDEPVKKKKKKRKSTGDEESMTDAAPLEDKITEKKSRRKSLPANLAAPLSDDSVQLKKLKKSAKTHSIEETGEMVVANKITPKKVNGTDITKSTGTLTSSKKKADVIETPSPTVGEKQASSKKKKKRVSEIISTPVAEELTPKGSSKKKTKKSEVPSTPISNDTIVVGETSSKKKKKRVSTSNAEVLSTPVSNDTIVVGETSSKKKKKRDSTSNAAISELPIVTSETKKKKRKSVEPKQEDDGDVEIWIPNKTYNGPLKNKLEAKAKKLAASPFASFEKSAMTPPALVRKADKSPKSSMKKISDKLPKTPTTEGKRRVSIVLSKNTAQDFEDSLTLSPAPAFDPRLRPENSILKASPLSSPKFTPKLSKLNKSKLVKRNKAADFF